MLVLSCGKIWRARSWGATVPTYNRCRAPLEPPYRLPRSAGLATHHWPCRWGCALHARFMRASSAHIFFLTPLPPPRQDSEEGAEVRRATITGNAMDVLNCERMLLSKLNALMAGPTLASSALESRLYNVPADKVGLPAWPSSRPLAGSRAQPGFFSHISRPLGLFVRTDWPRHWQGWPQRQEHPVPQWRADQRRQRRGPL